ncbi:MAG: indolepyruvate oxidoreductase subunit beta [Oscillospiraceae bacterium]|jgi:indolepyruvate ferredoxin oxidoreductase beta subunit
MSVKSILLVGVGGQGTILVSRLLTQGLIHAGYDVKMSEVHGMAQRGGSVSTQVRFGDKVYSPIIGPGQADILVAFEQMEAVRYASYLRPEGTAVINLRRIMPMPVASGKAEYPENTVEEMAKNFSVTAVDAYKIAEDLGSVKSMNVVILGVLIKAMGLTDIDWETVLRENLPEKSLEINLKALKAGLGQ